MHRARRVLDAAVALPGPGWGLGHGNVYQRPGDYDRGVSVDSLALQARIPDALEQAVARRLDDARRERVGERIASADPTLWAPPGTPEVANRLGWLTIAQRSLAGLDEVTSFAAECREDGVIDAVLLGMGGSSLAPEVLRRTFSEHVSAIRLHVLDSTDAATIRSVQDQIDPSRTLFIVSSKSGGTIEPLSLMAHFRTAAEPRNFIAITDPGTQLEVTATEQGFRHTFHGDPDIGGRYSALSAFGIVPGALMGVDVRALLEGAASAWSTPLANGDAEEPAAIWLGVVLSALARDGRDKLTFAIADTLPGLGLWLEQLFAESTGKQGTGILPVAEEPLLEADFYGDDRVFVQVSDAGQREPSVDGALAALSGAGHPVITIPTNGPLDLGRVFLLAEIAVAAAGWGLSINPFDQPNVQQAKDATKRVLGEYENAGRLSAPADADGERARELLVGGAPPDYVALMAYAQPTDEMDAAATELRAAIMRASRCTTTFGYGPRFLHSTGQFHKGGPRTGRFLQLLHDGPEDVAIPGAAYSFTTLKEAEAIGDLETLRQLGLPAERVRLREGDPAGALRDLAASIKEMR
jgi:transaldolase/glucose-6-phosphate isomerase